MTAPAHFGSIQLPLADGSRAAVPRAARSERRTPAVAAVAGLVLGGLTAYAQGWLPEELGSLANSSGSWVVVAFVLALPARSQLTAAVSAAAALLALLAGYVLGAGLQGHPASSSLLIFWGAAALVAGPALGVAAHGLRHGQTRVAAIGAGVLAGVLVGEGCYGLAAIADTTYPPFWVAEIAVGVAVLCAAAAWRLRRPGPILVSIATTGVVAAAFFAVYSAPLIGLL